MSKTPAPVAELLYTPAEVAERLRVNVKTVVRWAKSGKIPASEIVWTVGGHRRIKRAFIEAHLTGGRP